MKVPQICYGTELLGESWIKKGVDEWQLNSMVYWPL